MRVVLVNILVLLILVFIIDKVWYVLKPNNQPTERAIRLKEHQAFYHKALENIYSRCQQTAFRTDENGYLLPHGGNEVSNNIVVFLGGSTTECMSMPEEDRFPFRVGDMLLKDKSIDVKTLNSGVSGNSTQHSLNLLLNKIAPARPKMVVLMHAVNDLNTYLKCNSYWEAGGRYSNIRLTESKSDGWKTRLLPAIYPRMKSTFKSNQDSVSFEFPDLESIEPRLMQDFERNLELIVGICKAFNIELVLMTQARAFDVSSDETHLNGVKTIEEYDSIYFRNYIDVFEKLNTITRNVAQANRVKLIDLALENSLDGKLFYDAIHYNSKGSLKTSSIIADSLSKWSTQE